MNHPNFFVIGTPKGGTTSLFHYLEEHPEIFIPKIKEPHYFTHQEVAKSYYRPRIITSQNEYLDLYKDVTNETAIGDLSSSYLYHFKSANRIKNYNSESRIIVVLRNPVDRAISHYMMDISLGFVKASLMDIIDKKENFSQHYNQYVEVGQYSEGLAAYYEVFNENRIKIILSDDLFLNTTETMNELFDFLEVKDLQNLKFERKFNQYKEPRYDFVKRLHRNKIMEKLKDLISPEIKDKLKGFLFRTTAIKPEFIEERAALFNLLKEDIIFTEKLIGRDLSGWKSKL
ncbi:MAG: hypothetical protein HKN00_08375 [Flavobacteriaceae bacterium]|nr:sulfotransferase domain-containing protein [Bacteroidia bacterium]MBT8286657.1 sulfotransferase domain-containing protein [Bacteroidia bacterium]NNF75182.1 hypothetical protein [Flavobacteriaceae bacterium]NNK72445.1 hypothetical protein [Flavobacteriaceae bacterium]